MEKYLIMECEECGEEIIKTPLYMTDDWKKNLPNKCQFEVWELKNGYFELVKNYETAMEEGMAFYYWEKKEDPEKDMPHIIEKFPNRTRKDKCPSQIIAKLKTLDDCDDEKWISKSGYISAYDSKNEKYYVYGEYCDNYYKIGY